MTERYRTNAQGRAIQSNYDVDRVTESLYACGGCGRRFSAYDLPVYSLANEGARIMALNKARAMRHADRCEGPR